MNRSVVPTGSSKLPKCGIDLANRAKACWKYVDGVGSGQPKWRLVCHALVNGKIILARPGLRLLIGKMITLSSPPEIAKTLADRVRERRLARGWSQAEIARRAGVKLATFVAFERTGRVSLVRFIAIVDVLGLVSEVEHLGRTALPAGGSLADLAKPLPQRGKTRR